MLKTTFIFAIILLTGLNSAGAEINSETLPA